MNELSEWVDGLMNEREMERINLSQSYGIVQIYTPCWNEI